MTTTHLRPLSHWDGPITRDRAFTPFTAAWSSTRLLLWREVEQLGASVVVIEIDAEPNQFRVDGNLRSGARVLSPRCAVSFTGTHGPMRLQCDQFTTARDAQYAWQANVRAIALGLEALRRVDRYGIARSGEQYRGWTAIGAGTPMPAAPRQMTVDDAMTVLGLGLAGSVPPSPLVVTTAYRTVARRTHPDNGGDAEDFRRATEARDLLLSAGRKNFHEVLDDSR